MADPETSVLYLITSYALIGYYPKKAIVGIGTHGCTCTELYRQSFELGISSHCTGIKGNNRRSRNNGHGRGALAVFNAGGASKGMEAYRRISIVTLASNRNLLSEVCNTFPGGHQHRWLK